MPLKVIVLDDDFNPSLEPSKQRIIPLLVMHRFLTTPQTCGQECDVTFTASALEALRLMKGQCFDLFICDGNLGEENQKAGFTYGPELVREIQQGASRGEIQCPRRSIGWSATLEATIREGQTCQQEFESLGVDCFKKHGFNDGLKAILAELQRTAPIQATPLRLSNSAPLSLFGRSSPALPSSGEDFARSRSSTPTISSHSAVTRLGASKSW